MPNGLLRTRVVTIGDSRNGRVAILSGLRAGKREIPVGKGAEMQALRLKRFLPNVVFDRTAKMAPQR